ncbi:response regulator transcription factor [Microtetraspora malaysiensis]|uniref:helix-turn-helix transcriptional regulator n=1 Tax=Microtetraspora malaysiensis TaxID=161358 RepID=UPI003D937CE5
MAGLFLPSMFMGVERGPAHQQGQGERRQPCHILTAIRVVAAGDALIAPGVTRRLIEAFADRPASDPAPRELEGITEREREVFTLIAQGLTNTEIAADLVISVATVKAYVGRLLSKLDARDRVQLVILGYEAGLVSPSK